MMRLRGGVFAMSKKRSCFFDLVRVLVVLVFGFMLSSGVMMTAIAKEDSEEQENGCFIVDNIDLKEIKNNKPSYSKGKLSKDDVEYDFPAKYDVRDDVDVVRNKNQHTEGLCWAYSATTMLEYYVAKLKGAEIEISPKHIDYQTMGKDAGGDSRAYIGNERNVYYERYLKIPGAYDRKHLGSGGNVRQLTYAFLNPLAMMSENDFTAVIKENDDRLFSINQYEDIWNLSNKREILTNENGIHSSTEKENRYYTKKQEYTNINDSSKIDYIVTGAGIVSYDFDTGRASPDYAGNEINEIKKVISDYGAMLVAVGTGAACKSDNDLNTYVIDGTVDPNCSLNHAVLLVGWDDEWEYIYNGELKKGAFIIQSSWGEDKDNDREKWHLSYMSLMIKSLYVDSIEEYDKYDFYYGPDDYSEPTIMSDSDEYIFELFTNGDEQIKEVTFGDAISEENVQYNIYISATGNEEDFVEVAENVVFKPGITKYEFAEEYDLNGKYAVKLKRSDGEMMSDSYKASGTLNVMTDRVLILDINSGDGGDVSKKTCTPRLNSSCLVILPEDVPVRAGYSFIGYADTEDALIGQYQPGEAVSINGNKSIYAIFSPIFKLSINNMVDSVIERSCNPVVKDESCEIVVPFDVTAYGERYLIGYADTEDAAEVKYQFNDKIALSADKSIYAVWADGNIEWQDDDKNYEIGSSKNMVFKIGYPMMNFVKLMLDYEEIDNSKNDRYKIESGSTIITIYSDYLDTIEEGDHKLQVVYDNGVVKEIDFVVERDIELSVPNTGADIKDGNLMSSSTELLFGFIIVAFGVSSCVILNKKYGVGLR